MLRLGSGVLLRLPSSVPTRPVVVDPTGITRGRSFLMFFDEQRKPLLRVLHRHLWLTSERSPGLDDDDGDCLVLADVRVAADIVSNEIAPRWSLSSVSAAIHWPILGVDALVDDVVAPRRSLSSASAAPHWPTLDVGDVLVDGVKEFSTGIN